jgi:tetratricopeptide (TPR) repeat protein
MADHFYLQSDMIPWLSIEERKAIDAGFQMAIAHKFNGASPALAAFWADLHHDAAEADVLAQASSAADQPSRQAELLLQAGTAYLQAGETARAAAAFKQAARIEPSNPKPYEYLVTQILAPRRDIDSARAVVQIGLNNDADPFRLYLSLAQVYERLGDVSGAEAALLQAARLNPGDRYDYDTLMRLAVEVRPGSAEVLYQLALAEETDYEYGQALRDLARAISLAPQDAGMRNHYRDMLRMIAAHSDHNHSSNVVR